MSSYSSSTAASRRLLLERLLAWGSHKDPTEFVVFTSLLDFVFVDCGSATNKIMFVYFLVYNLCVLLDRILPSSFFDFFLVGVVLARAQLCVCRELATLQNKQ